MQHDFEDVEVKINAPQVLDRQLHSRRNKCMLFSGSMSDHYMPIEQDLQLTRQCLEVIATRRCGVCIQTKSDLILRDANCCARSTATARLSSR